jgi:hypothetical protein
VPWTLSRILGNFLVYRKLERLFSLGEKKRAIKYSKRLFRISKLEPYDLFNSSINKCLVFVIALSFDFLNSNSICKKAKQSLISLLVNLYGFKKEGLIKKTVSVIVGGVFYYFILYYTIVNIINNKFTMLFKNPRF